ncbi:hypothetical protein IGL98_001401 [Enterococcus sp. DIV0840]|uniref:hypothetical protein n=1 Tax=Enterococcus TaxID=1350 RepID=UPI001A8E2276|nr:MULTISPECIES: hypothetical protein [Enterococcus]MBO0434901.1 hypothetical protein [Enterococcus sp. DIV0849a]MBO0474393.1 hypothetical protein [Enterococcus ureasiticus]
MKKVVKILGILVGGLLVVVFLVFVGIYANNKIHLKKETKKIIPYGQEVKVDNKSLRVQVTGIGDETMVLLPGYLTGSPVLDFQPLVNELSKKIRSSWWNPSAMG